MALLKRFSFILLFMSLIGCGGGDGGLGNGGNPDPQPEVVAIQLSISDSVVSEQSPATVSATVTLGGNVVAQKLVTFTTTLGAFDPSSGTALTNDQGVASIVLTAGDVAGAGEILAKVDNEESNKVGFTTQGTQEVVLSLGSGDPFTAGVASLSLPQISAGATSTVGVEIRDANGNLFSERATVNFTSVCSEGDTPTAELDREVITSNGIAESNYLAKGCVGDDPITVNTTVNGQNLTANTVINVLPADVGSIEFVSVSPQTIGIKGTGAVGGAESSTVIFKVLDTNGNPVNNQLVDFELSTSTGEITFTPEQASTNAEGFVQTVVNSGTVATSVRVYATVNGSSPVISSQSSVLVVSTGIPDQDSFTLGADIINAEAWDIQGTEVIVTARLADAFNNPVPDGTAVTFTTEGGSIEPSCLTENGACAVKWTSQFPKPEGHVLGDANNPGHLPEEQNTMGQKYGGRVTIVATAIGEESFPDLNGNGRFDEEEMSAFQGTNVSGLPYDLTEAYSDYNEDGFFNPGEVNAGEEIGGELEEYYDFNNDGSFTQADGLYNGILCAIPAHAGCSETQKSINVRRQMVIIMSGSTPYFNRVEPVSGEITLNGEESATVSVIISDLHNQPMPAGTTIEFETTVGSVEVGASQSWANDGHNGGAMWSAVIKGQTESASGNVVVTVTTPSGLATSFIIANVTVIGT